MSTKSFYLVQWFFWDSLWYFHKQDIFFLFIYLYLCEDWQKKKKKKNHNPYEVRIALNDHGIPWVDNVFNLSFLFINTKKIMENAPK